MRKFIVRRIHQGASPASPLFLDYDSILTRFRFIFYLRHLIVRLGLDKNAYGGHSAVSFRIGAATSAGSDYIEDHLIQTMGRWSSYCYVRYIRTSDSLHKAQLAMCTISNSYL